VRPVALARLSLTLLAAGCVSSGPVRGSPLYPASGGVLPPDQVATLNGYVAEVDGQDVSEQVPPFELLPGCHIVYTPERWGSVTAGVTATAQTGKRPFAFPMRAGHFYRIEVITQVQTSISGSLEITGFETDAAGQQTRVFTAVTDPAELEACRKGELRASGI
jgi:hypothetical protein